MKPIDILKGAKALLVTKGWTQGDMARDAEGDPVHIWSEAASCFCAYGALRAATPGGVGASYAQMDAASALEATIGDEWPDFIEFNDAPVRTKDEIVAKFDEAIAALEAGCVPQA